MDLFFSPFEAMRIAVATSKMLNAVALAWSEFYWDVIDPWW